MATFDEMSYSDVRPACTFVLDPRKTALVIVDVQYSNCSRDYGMGKRLKEQSEEEIKKAGYDPTALQYRYDRIENVLLPKLSNLLDFFRENKLKVIHVTLGSQRADFDDISPHIRTPMEWANNRKGEREHEILNEIKPAADEFLVNKTTNGTFASTGIDSLLRTHGMKYVLIAGVTTEFCPGTTAREAADRGYSVVMLDDCCASLAESWHRIWMTQFQMFFGRVATSDEVVKELQSELTK